MIGVDTPYCGACAVFKCLADHIIRFVKWLGRLISCGHEESNTEKKTKEVAKRKLAINQDEENNDSFDLENKKTGEYIKLQNKHVDTEKTNITKGVLNKEAGNSNESQNEPVDAGKSITLNAIRSLIKNNFSNSNDLDIFIKFLQQSDAQILKEFEYIIRDRATGATFPTYMLKDLIKYNGKIMGIEAISFEAKNKKVCYMAIDFYNTTSLEFTNTEYQRTLEYKDQNNKVYNSCLFNSNGHSRLESRIILLYKDENGEVRESGEVDKSGQLVQ